MHTLKYTSPKCAVIGLGPSVKCIQLLQIQVRASNADWLMHTGFLFKCTWS